MVKRGAGNFRAGGKRAAWPDWVFTDAVSGQASISGSRSDVLTETDSISGDIEADGSLTTIQTVNNVNSGGVESDGSIVQPILISTADGGEMEVGGSLTHTTLSETATSGNIDVDSNTTTAQTEFGATSGEVGLTGTVSVTILKQDVTSGEVDVDGTTIPLDDYFSIINADAVSGEVEVSANQTETNWNALVGGTIKFADGSGKPSEAQIHIIRNNDNTKVVSTTTDSSGNWSVTLPTDGVIESTDSDPPVYSIEVYHREGAVGHSAEIYHALNRPYLDTDDPSETSPYDKYYYKE